MSVEPDPSANRYWGEVDPDVPNNSNAWALAMTGSNKRVLELGPAAGHVTRALVARGCQVVCVEYDADAAAALEDVAETVVVGDASDPAVLRAAVGDELVDVVMCGDVLEHLPDPLAVLRACRALLRPDGYVVLSVPNVAHADVKLQLLNGRFPYTDTGLLDRTHLHFFTLDAIHEMLRDAGLVAIDLERVVVPVFATEQGVDRTTVSDEVLKEVLADPESEVYQFVVRAVRHDGDLEVGRLAERVVQLETEVRRSTTRIEQLEAEVDSVGEELETMRGLEAQAVEQARSFEALAQEHEAHVQALTSTRSYRMLAPFRAVFRRRS